MSRRGRCGKRCYTSKSVRGVCACISIIKLSVVALSHTCRTPCLSDPLYHEEDDSEPPTETNSSAPLAPTLALVLVLGVVPTAQGLA